MTREGYGRDSMQMMKQTLKTEMASSQQQLTVLDCCLYLNTRKWEKLKNGIPYAICIEQFTTGSLTVI